MPNHKQLDPYVYPGTTVLINKFDIRDQDKLDQYELMLFTAQASEPLPIGKFDYTHLKEIHKHFFADLYEWAGQERTVDIAKDGHLFAHTQYITGEMNKLLDKLKKENFLQDLDNQQFKERLSYYFNEINAAHPFREGNGRTQRAFCDLVADQAGYKLDWTQVTTEAYIQASIDGHLGNYDSMTNVFDKITVQQIQTREQTMVHLDDTAMDKIKLYIARQVELVELVNKKNEHLASYPNTAKQLGEQASLLGYELKSLAKNIVEDKSMKDIINKPQLINLHKQGGFTEIHTRAQNNNLNQDDIIAVVKHAQGRVISLSETLSQALKAYR